MSQKHKLPYKIFYTAFVAVSIDGRIAENNRSGADWTSKEDWNFFQKSLAKTDAVIVGRNTYKIAKNYLKRRKAVIVLTSKVNKLKLFDSVTFLNPKHSNILDFLNKKKYKKIAILGGPKVYNFCLQNRMINELFVTIEPYVFTNGICMFSGDKFMKHNFILESVKKLNKKGTILLKYKYAN